MPDEEVGRDGRLGEAGAAARVSAAQGGGRGGGALDVPVRYDGRRLGKYRTMNVYKSMKENDQ